MSASAVRPPFDPEVERALADPVTPVVTGLSRAEIAALRRLAAPRRPDDLAREYGVEITEHQVEVPWDGAEVTVVVARPRGATRPVPALYHVHGGGLVAGSAMIDLPPALELAATVGAAVASVEYRLAPEWSFPAAVEDVHAGWVWLATTAEELGLDPGRLVIAGVSAGGGLAAAATLLGRDRGTTQPCGQLLVYPMLDDRNDSCSGRQMAGVGAWDRSANATGWSAYLGPRAGGPDVPGHAAPARELDLSGLPPTFIDVASAETFRDEDVMFAMRIWACGGRAELHVWPGGCHGFDALVPGAQISQDAVQARVRWLRRVLSCP